MSRKLHVAFPACFVLVVVLLIGYFCIVGGSVQDGSLQAENAAASVQEISGKSLSAPAEVVTTTVPQEPAEEVNSAQEVSESTPGESGYILTESERIAVECAVMCEAGGEGHRGQMMVAQSILDGSLRNGFDVFETIYAYQVHSTTYDNVTDEVRESVSRVFDDGERVTEEKTDLWYNPALVQSQWHEEQQYIITVGSHRFFWMNDDM